MKMPEPGQTADYKLQLTCAECEELIKAVDQIFTIAKDNTAHVTANLLQYNPQEHVRFVSAAFRLARFVRDEITEDLVTS